MKKPIMIAACAAVVLAAVAGITLWSRQEKNIQTIETRSMTTRTQQSADKIFAPAGETPTTTADAKPKTEPEQLAPPVPQPAKPEPTRQQTPIPVEVKVNGVRHCISTPDDPISYAKPIVVEWTAPVGAECTMDNPAWGDNQVRRSVPPSGTRTVQPNGSTDYLFMLECVVNGQLEYDAGMLSVGNLCECNGPSGKVLLERCWR